MAVTSSTGCAGKNAVGRGAGIRFDILEHEALEDADLLEHQRVLKSGTRRRPWGRCRRSLPGTHKQRYLGVKVCLPELNLIAVCVSSASLG